MLAERNELRLGNWIYRNPRAICVFLSFLLIGGDELSFKLSGFTIRLVAFTLLGAFLLDILRADRRFPIDRTALILSGFLVACALLSLPGSYDTKRTVAYIIWIAFTFSIVVPVFYAFARRRYTIDALSTWLWVYRLHVALLILETVGRAFTGSLDIGMNERPHLWFYESSYMAIFIAGYAGAAIYLLSRGSKSARIDVILVLVACVLLASATAMLVLSIAVVVNVALSSKPIRLALASALAGAIGFATLTLLFSGTAIYRLSVGFLLNSDADLLVTILQRAGTRFPRFLFGMDAFFQHPFTGIGFGADQTYTATVPPPALAEEYLLPGFPMTGNPFTNIFVEAAGTMGVGGLVAVAALLVLAVVRYVQLGPCESESKIHARAVLVGFFVMIAAMQLEGTFLRFYIWSTFGLALGIAASAIAHSEARYGR